MCVFESFHYENCDSGSFLTQRTIPLQLFILSYETKTNNKTYIYLVSQGYMHCIRKCCKQPFLMKINNISNMKFSRIELYYGFQVPILIQPPWHQFFFFHFSNSQWLVTSSDLWQYVLYHKSLEDAERLLMGCPDLSLEIARLAGCKIRSWGRLNIKMLS